MSREADLIIHADWGSDPKKRWMCVSRRVGSSYEVKAPEPVGALDTFWRRIAARAKGGSAVVGFDFPIGLPRSYAFFPRSTSIVYLVLQWKPWLPLTANVMRLGYI
jgi:hypothetical protein